MGRFDAKDRVGRFDGKRWKVEVRPSSVKNGIFAGFLCAIFTVIGVWMIFSGQAVLVGLLTVVFFGGGGLYAVPKLMRRKVSMVLSSEGIEQVYPQGSAVIPWDDIDSVGVVSMFSNKMVGIRLRSYDGYLNRMSPDLAAFFVKSLPYLKALTAATSVLEAPTAIVLWSKLQGTDARAALNSFGSVGSLAEALMWSRNTYGYDLILSWAEVDRSASEFVKLLEEYRSRGT